LEDPIAEAIIKLQVKTGQKLLIGLTDDGKNTKVDFIS
jgi:hypothetical protein